MTTDPEQLGLVGFALDAARALKRQFPSLVFTSGRRAAADQARAMAQNVAKPGRRTWIARTYRQSPLRGRLQKAVDANPGARTVPELTHVLMAVFEQTPDSELERFSFHIIGRAFDVQPHCVPFDEFRAAVATLPGLDKFLSEEGGEVRWHLQFVPKPQEKFA